MPDTLHDLILAIVVEAQALHGEEPENAPGQYLSAALNAFAADVVNRILPEDPVAQAAVIRKAQELGIDIGDHRAGNVVNMLDHMPRK